MNTNIWIFCGLLAGVFTTLTIYKGLNIEDLNWYKNYWLILGLLAGAFTTFAIPYGFHLKAQATEQNQNTSKKDVGNSSDNTEKLALNLILTEHEGEDIFIDSNEHNEFGFRISGEFNDFINIEILFRRTNGLCSLRKNELEDIFYPLIEFGERVQITSAIRPDKLGILLKWNYISEFVLTTP